MGKRRRSRGERECNGGDRGLVRDVRYAEPCKIEAG